MSPAFLPDFFPACGLRGSHSQRAGGVRVLDPASASALCEWILFDYTGPVGLDTETIGANPKEVSPVRRALPVCGSLAVFDADLGHHEKTSAPLARRYFIPSWDSYDVWYALREFLEDTEPRKVGSNLLDWDRPALANIGIQLRGMYYDTVHGSRLATTTKLVEHGLKPCAERHLSYDMVDFKEILARPGDGATREPKKPTRSKAALPDGTKVPRLREGPAQNVNWGTTKLIDIARLPYDYPSRLASFIDYATLDAKASLELLPPGKELLERKTWRRRPGQETLWEFWEQIRRPILEAYADMVEHGWCVDLDAWEESEKLASEEAAKTGDELDFLAGQQINWNSAPQVQHFLYGESPDVVVAGGETIYPLGVDVPPVCRSGPTPQGTCPIDRDAVKFLKHHAADSFDRELFTTMLAHKQAERMVMYARKLREHTVGGRLSCMLGPTTDTGRCAAKNPALQQIPSRHDVFKLRRGFVAAPGCKLVVCDYSSLEMFIQAHIMIRLFGDRRLLDDLLSADVHSATAVRAWGAYDDRLPPLAGTDLRETNDPELVKYRDDGKTLNYATAYGQGPAGMGAAILDAQGNPVGAAVGAALHDDYVATYPALPQYQEWALECVERDGFVRTLLGRYRIILLDRYARQSEINKAKRVACNTCIQGSAADILEAAILRIRDRGRLERMGWKLVMSIHDEIVAEGPEKGADEAAAEIQTCMEDPVSWLGFELAVPLEAKPSVVDRWSEAK